MTNQDRIEETNKEINMCENIEGKVGKRCGKKLESERGERGSVAHLLYHLIKGSYLPLPSVVK